MSNRKRGINNVLTDLVSKLIVLALGVIVPRFILVSLGSEANGLMSSVTQILTYLSLLEAGVGSASLQALYKPISQENHEESSGILSATNVFYRRTGIIYLSIVVLISIVYPFAVKSEIPRLTIALVVLSNGVPSALSYLIQGKYRILLQAEGKNYILITLSTIVSISLNIIKIILLRNGFGLIELQLSHFVINLVQLLFIVLYIKKNYSWLNLKTTPDFQAISQSKGALIHQISGLIFGNTDVILLTFFCDLSVVSVYSMYKMIFGLVESVVSSIGGVGFAMGQIYQNDKERFVKVNSIFEIVYITLTFSLNAIAMLFITPFLSLYTRGVDGISYIDKWLPYLFVTISLLSNARIPSANVIYYAGHIKKTQNRAILEAVINLTSSIVLVQYWGVYGVLIGTIIALLYRTNDIIIYAYHTILHKSIWPTFRRWLINMALFVCSIWIGTTLISSMAFDSYFRIITIASAFGIIILPLYFIIVMVPEKEIVPEIKALLVQKLRIMKVKINSRWSK